MAEIHPAWSVPGGVRDPLTMEARERLRPRLPEMFNTIHGALRFFKTFLDSHEEETETFGNFPSLFMGLVGSSGTWENYDGHLRFTDHTGKIVAECHDMNRYQEFIGEAVEKDSFLKSPYYRPLGYPDGIYRVGPLARLNICTSIGTPQADRELTEFRQRGHGTPNASFYFHYARLVEILAGLEAIERLLDDSELQSERLRAHAGINQLEGVGVSEAPRGTLFHHYRVDDNGLLQKINLIIATGQNSLAMNKTIAQIAKKYIKGRHIPEPVLNRVEAGIRAFDPCLSCSTHAFGQMPFQVRLIDADGQLIDERCRNKS